VFNVLPIGIVVNVLPPPSQQGAWLQDTTRSKGASSIQPCSCTLVPLCSTAPPWAHATPASTLRSSRLRTPSAPSPPSTLVSSGPVLRRAHCECEPLSCVVPPCPPCLPAPAADSREPGHSAAVVSQRHQWADSCGESWDLLPCACPPTDAQPWLPCPCPCPCLYFSVLTCACTHTCGSVQPFSCSLTRARALSCACACACHVPLQQLADAAAAIYLGQSDYADWLQKNPFKMKTAYTAIGTQIISAVSNAVKVLYCAALCCTVLCCTILYYAVLCCTAPHCAVLCFAVQYCACTVLYSTPPCACLAPCRSWRPDPPPHASFLSPLQIVAAKRTTS